MPAGCRSVVFRSHPFLYSLPHTCVSPGKTAARGVRVACRVLAVSQNHARSPRGFGFFFLSSSPLFDITVLSDSSIFHDGFPRETGLPPSPWPTSWRDRNVNVPLGLYPSVAALVWYNISCILYLLTNIICMFITFHGDYNIVRVPCSPVFKVQISPWPCLCKCSCILWTGRSREAVRFRVTHK